MKTLTVIVPCFNEESLIEESHQRIHNALASLTLQTEIIYVNDGSTDRTGFLLDKIAEADSCVKVLHFSRNFGHQPAVTAGIKYCDADVAVIMDADMQDPPELIPAILQTLTDQGANVVYCVRKERKGESYFKCWSARHFYRTINKMSEVAFPLDTGDFRMIDRRVMDEFRKLKERGKYIRGLISWIGFKQVPFYYTREARLSGETKYPLRKMIKFAANAMLYFSTRPLQLAIKLGFLAFFIGIILGIWFVLGKVFGFTNAETGWTSTVIIVIFFGGIQLLTVGVLGQYVGILLEEVKARPEYIVSEKRNC